MTPPDRKPTYSLVRRTALWTAAVAFATTLASVAAMGVLNVLTGERLPFLVLFVLAGVASAVGGLAVAGRVAAWLRPVQAWAEHASAMASGHNNTPPPALDLVELAPLAEGVDLLAQRADAAARSAWRLAYADAGTGLPNRDRLRLAIEETLAGLDPNGPPAVLIALETDGSARMRDTLGRQIGEVLHKQVSERLQVAARAADRILRLRNGAVRPSILARTGAADFAVLVPDLADVREAMRFAQLIAAALRQPYSVGNHRVQLEASLGMALMPEHASSAEEAMRAAELAQSHARRHGPGQVRVFDPRMNQEALDRLILENEIRAAIESGQFSAHFQPKIDLSSGRLIGCEALVRWNHPERGLVGPDAFIDVAEESGLIGPLGDLILRDASRRAAHWLKRGLGMRVAVNVSAAQFGDDAFSQRILGILTETGLPAPLFEIEITESVAMADPDRVVRLIEPLRRKGVRIAMDDFGAGHSNLAALTRLPFDVFKIDRSFIQALGRDRHAPILIETIIAMAGGLNYETVAEGVETPEQAQFLREAGVNTAQGFLFGPPMPPDRFEEHARDWIAARHGAGAEGGGAEGGGGQGRGAAPRVPALS